MRYFNTAFSLSMITAPATLQIDELAPEEASRWLQGEIRNVANPNHSNTLDAISKKLHVSVYEAAGGRVKLNSGDEMLVAQVSFPPSIPRETKEYTDEQLALGTFIFQLVTVF